MFHCAQLGVKKREKGVFETTIEGLPQHNPPGRNTAPPDHTERIAKGGKAIVGNYF